MHERFPAKDKGKEAGVWRSLRPEYQSERVGKEEEWGRKGLRSVNIAIHGPARLI